MRKTTLWVGVLFLVFGTASCTTKTPQRPNIIYILADDLGYGELGSYGQTKINTPHLDALAQKGMRFTNHYAGAPVCAPSRCVFLTGKHAGKAQVRSNDEWTERGPEVNNYKAAADNPAFEGQRPIRANTTSLATVLQQNGYRTSVFGKWGLGAPGTDGVPTKQGFDYFYGYNCQRQAHNLYPLHLWENETKIPLDNQLVHPHAALPKNADPNDPKSYAKYTQKEYAPKMIHDKALEFIQQQTDQPFFMYYASPLPHLPLQVPTEELEQYKRIFEEQPYIGNHAYFPHQYPRSAYAAMITYLDKQVGELIAELKKKGVYENTVIIFSSDNGPSYLGGLDFNFFESSKPLTNGYGRTKGFLYEGGIRVPLVVSWEGKVQPSSVTNHTCASYDLLPTLCEFAQVKPPKDLDGISFAPTLLGNGKQTKHEFLYWEFPSYEGQQAVRLGNWKGIRKNIFKGNMEIELYDLEQDPQEQHNLAADKPEVVAEIAKIMQEQHHPSENPKFQFPQLGDK